MKYYKSIDDFKVNSIYKMNPTSRSHSKKPYFVYIKSITKEYIETSIPFFHSLKIRIKDKKMWDYHTARMTKYGDIKNDSKLLYWQKTLVPFSLKEKAINILHNI